MNVAVLWLFILPTVLGIDAESEQISPTLTQQELLHRLETRTNLIILDVRTPQEFVASHIPGAVKVPPTALCTRIETGRSYQDKGVALYCEARAQRSSLPLKIP
jgi:rhodanese-related sulfurtransferase